MELKEEYRYHECMSCMAPIKVIKVVGKPLVSRCKRCNNEHQLRFFKNGNVRIRNMGGSKLDEKYIQRRG